MLYWLTRRAIAVAFVSVLLAGCGGGNSAAPPTGGLKVVPGDGQVTVSWNADAGVEYWLFFAAAEGVTTRNWNSLTGGAARLNVFSPYVLTGLTNGVTYSFTMDGRTDGGPGGPGAPTVTAVPRLAGVSWTAGGSLGSLDMQGIAYGTASNTTAYYLAVGNGGAQYQSTDGVNWTAISGATTSNLNAALYTLSRFITVGASGTVLSSSDLATWTAGTSVTNQNLNALASNGTTVVAVGDGGTIQYSTDGLTWNAAAAVPTTKPLYGITYAASGLWVAVGAGGTVITSSDGSTWTTVSSGTSSTLRAVSVQASTAYTYVAVGDGGTVLTSTDGVTWAAQNVSPAANLLALAASTGQFVAVGTGGAVFTSPDGINWTGQTTGTSVNLLAVLGGSLAQYVTTGSGGASYYSR